MLSVLIALEHVFEDAAFTSESVSSASFFSFFAKNDLMDEAPEAFEISSNLLAFRERDVTPGCL